MGNAFGAEDELRQDMLSELETRDRSLSTTTPGNWQVHPFTPLRIGSYTFGPLESGNYISHIEYYDFWMGW
jgi:hypothetical protein